uniref:Kaptin n=1 Tax=Trichobilharzia regenti TaxID=157069 RepID=A0AA85JY76_TRIRE|nr:unnamed protein product [Trichobilharzia regenti]
MPFPFIGSIKYIQSYLYAVGISASSLVSDPLASKYCFTIHHFDIEDGIIQPQTKTIDFAYLPGASDIVCINALHDEITDEYFVAVGFVKEGENGYLNIYRSRSEEKLPENCLSYSKLPCVPLHLVHAHCLIKDELQWAFFLSFGEPFTETSNQSESKTQPRIKIFSKLLDTNILEETENDEETEKLGLNHSQTTLLLFPELANLPSTSIFLNMDFKIMDNLRLSAFGSQDGWFGVFAVDMKARRVVQHFHYSHESPITSIKVFQHFSTRNVNSKDTTTNGDKKSECVQLKYINCLVCSAFELSVVYWDIFKHNGFGSQNQYILPCSADFDHVNCASVGDFNLDGKPEIILGTFGQRLLYYEWEYSDTELKSGRYTLKSQRSLPGPVFSISPPLDLIGEGLLSFAVLTSRGLHVFQHDIQCLIKEIHHRLNKCVTQPAILST